MTDLIENNHSKALLHKKRRIAIDRLLSLCSSSLFPKSSDEKQIKADTNHAPANLSLDSFAFFKVLEITYEEKAPRMEALENVLSNLRLPGINLLFLIIGDRKGVSFYYGVSKDLTEISKGLIVSENIRNFCEGILKSSMEGNFRGCRTIILTDEENLEILHTLKDMPFITCVQGVPGQIEDREHYQSVDRLVDVMNGDTYAYLVTAKFLTERCVSAIENNVYSLYDLLKPCSKMSQQIVTGSSVTNIDTRNTGTNLTKGSTHTTGTTNNYGRTIQTSRTTPDEKNKERSQTATSIDATKASSKQESDATSDSTVTIDTRNFGNNRSDTFSDTLSFEISYHKTERWLRYLDESVLKRLDYGRGKGIFITNITLLADTNNTLRKLINTTEALFSGESDNMAPLSEKFVENGSKFDEAIRSFQIPFFEFEKSLSSNDEVFLRTALSQYTNRVRGYFGNWFTVRELSMVSGLPQKEILGLKLREEVEFGLNYKDIPQEYRLELGHLVRCGTELKNITVSLDTRDLNKHIFVTGTTGSGKTTTCQKILLKSGLPFMVIEPSKTEYRILADSDPELLVFTLGRDDVAPFRINPLEFFPHETISSHVDMVKASIESAFDMEAAIPQIIEKSLYDCYENFGWDLSTKKNKYYSEPYADGIYAFPTFKDLIKQCRKVVEEQNFDDRLKNEYIGSINARLMGLTVGSKGQMLCSKRSIDFSELVKRKVILEIEDVKDIGEKALVMGFVVSNLIEAIRASYYKNPYFRHITLIEEAHRLLKSYSPGDSLSRKNAVEIFTNMLAEVRKYGESLVIADQVPSNMTPEVLKNTNTKIIHKIFGEDEHNAIGNTIALRKEQKDFLSCLSLGRAVVFSQGWDNSLQVQIEPETDTSEVVNKIDQDHECQKRALLFYCSCYQKGVIKVFRCCEVDPDTDKLKFLVYEIAPQLANLSKFFCELREKSFKLENSTNMNQYADSICFLLKHITKLSIAEYMEEECFSLQSRFAIESQPDGKGKLRCELCKFIDMIQQKNCNLSVFNSNSFLSSN